MTPHRALPILRALADGIDSHTGEVFPVGSAYQHPDTVRALLAAVAALESAGAAAAKESQQPPLPPQAGKSWSAEEDAHLREAFAAGSTVPALAESHARSRGAIRSRLMRLGLMTVDAPPA